MRKILTYFLFVPCLFLGACASGAQSKNMVVHFSPQTAAKKGSSLYNNVVLSTVDGGKDTNPMWTSQVSDDAFRSALRETLIENHYLARGKGRYTLHTDLIDLKQPLFGLTFDVDSTVKYTLEDQRRKRVKYAQKISESGEATFSDSALAIARLRMADEKSMQNNLKAFTEDLHRLK